jgi:hypothetical protein
MSSCSESDSLGSTGVDRRRRRWIATALLLAAAPLLSACGGPVDAEQAAACIRDAFAKRNDYIAGLAGFLGAERRYPKLWVSAIRLEACREADAATYRCLVEYRVAIEGGEEKTRAFFALLAGLDASGEEELFQVHWVFTVGSQAFTCRHD